MLKILSTRDKAFYAIIIYYNVNAWIYFYFDVNEFQLMFIQLIKYINDYLANNSLIKGREKKVIYPDGGI